MRGFFIDVALPRFFDFHIFVKKNLPSLFVKYKQSILYGVSLAVMLFLLRWLEWNLVVVSHAFEIYIGIIALIFTALGSWLAIKLTRPKTHTIVIEKEVFLNRAEFTINDSQLQHYGISPRELEVLQLIAKGHTNNEIAEQLFVSLNTVKSHSQNLFLKLGVNRRTQAVQEAKKAGLIA